MSEQTVTLADAAATQAWAEKIAPLLQPGDVLLLAGDLGAGKTTFTKGLAAGLGIKRNVKSPTFMLIKEYHSGRLPLYHMDVYRLENGGADDLGLDDYFLGDGVCVVEWAKFVQEYLPTSYVEISLAKDDANPNLRTAHVTGTGARGQALANAINQIN